MTDCDHVWKFAKDEQGKATPRLMVCDWCKVTIVPNYREDDLSPLEKFQLMKALSEAIETNILLSADVVQ